MLWNTGINMMTFYMLVGYRDRSACAKGGLRLNKETYYVVNPVQPRWKREHAVYGRNITGSNSLCSYISFPAWYGHPGAHQSQLASFHWNLSHVEDMSFSHSAPRATSHASNMICVAGYACIGEWELRFQHLEGNQWRFGRIFKQLSCK